MSGVTSTPPRPENNHPPPLSAFKTNYFGDPFLSHPSGSEEQLVPLDTRHLLSGPSQENHNLQQQSPDEIPSFTSSRGGLDAHSGSSYHSSQSPPGLFSPGSNTENGHSDLSGFPSPGVESHLFGDDQAHLAAQIADLEHLYIDPEVIYSSTYRNSKYDEHASAQVDGYPGANQLLSPVLTTTPSPSTIPYQLVADASATNASHDTVSPASMTSERRHQLPTLQLPPLATTPCSNTTEPNETIPTEPPPSPVVKISSYSRGDSPSRENDMLSPKPRRRSISSTHLAPENHESDESEGEDGGDEIVHAQGDARDSPTPPTRRAVDGSWIRNSTTGLGGVDPSARTAEYVPNLREMTEQREIQEKNAVVERWLSVSEANSEAEDNNLFGFQTQKKWRLTRRRRSRSTGSAVPRDKLNFSQPLFDDSTIPGPGALIDEKSEVEDDEDEDDTQSCDSSLPRSPGNLETNSVQNSEDGYFPPMDSLSINNDEPLPRQFIRARPWKDPPRYSAFGDMKEQPNTSNAAIFRFLRRADNIETASRRATWGTREVTEVDVESILGNNSRFDLMRISDDGVKERFFRRTSIFEHASKLLPKRSHSGAKRKHSISTQQPQPSEESIETGKSSPSSILPQRKPSFTRRSKLPTHTGGALLEMGRQIASVGVGTPVEVQPSKPSGPWSSLMRRSRSRSDVPKGLRSPTSGKSVQNMIASGGPSAPTAISPTQDQISGAAVHTRKPPLNNEDDADDNEHENDDDDEEMGDENGVVMDFPVRADLIVPTLEGFKTHVRQLNPRLQPALVERIGQEQLRRYKKLVENKLKHAQAVSRTSCTSGKHCFAQGGNATILPPKTSPKEQEMSYGQFKITTMVASNDDANTGSDGSVTPAMFPPGVPLPPVKRLPAEFECPLCFKVRKFQKPSDWTKHVHEDIQPFTCTFPECPDPKSFKRKADWVRHENERHRHLEWWACSIPDCSHVCHRRDNFVQHLVREHKLPDQPRGKGVKGRGAKAGKSVPLDDIPYSQDAEKVAELVESCRHVTNKQPTDEACKFCGNVCNSWKKLTVHLAKHMEQIALPLLSLVEQRTVSANMAVSPVDESGVSSAQSNMTTPVDAYPNTPSLGAQGKLSSQSQRGRGKNRNGPQPIVYGTAALLTEAFSVQKSSVSSQKLQMHNALSAGPSNAPQQQQHQHQQYSMPSNAYNVQHPYSQRSSPTLQGNGHPPRMQKQPGDGNVATYPLAFSAPPRQPVGMEAMTTNGMPPYNLNMPSSTDPVAGFDGGQIYSSPVEQFSYGEGFAAPTGMEHRAPAGSIPYTSPPVGGAGLGYQMEPSGSGQGYVFAHPANGQHQF